MRAKASKDGLTLRAIAGTNNVLLAMDLIEAKRQGCLGFSIERTDVDTGDRRWLPNMLRFPSDQTDAPLPSDTKDKVKPGVLTTARAPLQKFRWGDYTLEPGKRYRYRAVARYEKVREIIDKGLEAEKRMVFDTIEGGVTVEVRTENNRLPADTAVFFNRGAAASDAYVRRFGKNDPKKIPDALVWLSRGLEEALIEFIGSARDASFELHAAIYEFQKPELLAALKLADRRHVKVKVVYHAREKHDPKDHTARDNKAAIANQEIVFATPRKANPQDAIMHNKFVVLLEHGKPKAVWTGSTNWSEGAIYGQLNLGHAIYDPALAETYEKYFQLLHADKSAGDTKQANAKLTPVPADSQSVPHGITPIFSPQSSLDMIDLYAGICRQAKVLLVAAPFELHQKIREVFDSTSVDTLRFLMADTPKSFGKKGAMELMQRDPGNKATVATILRTRLNDFQGRLLEDAESFHHKGVHVHSKIIAADPFSSDPILVTGSANFSENSTIKNDSNTLVIRGDTATMDIYATEFMRMFEHYWFRAHINGATKSSKKMKTKEARLHGLKEDDTWSDHFYVPGSSEMRDRLAFAGIVT